MTMTDPIADMCTRIRNANTNRSKSVSMPASRIKVGIAQILKDEGFVRDYKVDPGKPASQLVIALKYGEQGDHVIRKIERVSKPGRRVYAKAAELTPVLRGMGIHIISTPKGILSDRHARQENLGGEILCKVY
jgi:small subunit ribosomal protein S8